MRFLRSLLQAEVRASPDQGNFRPFQRRVGLAAERPAGRLRTLSLSWVFRRSPFVSNRGDFSKAPETKTTCKRKKVWVSAGSLSFANLTRSHANATCKKIMARQTILFRSWPGRTKSFSVFPGMSGAQVEESFFIT